MEINLDKKQKTYKIKSNICLMCGERFGKEKGEDTMQVSEHHSIPGKMKPMFNVVIPLHIKCHRKLNRFFILRSEVIKMEQKIDSIKASFLRIKNGVNE